MSDIKDTIREELAAKVMSIVLSGTASTASTCDAADAYCIADAALDLLRAHGYTKPDARVRAVVEARIVELRKQQDAHGKHDELWQRFNDRLYEVMLIREALSALDTPATESAPALRGSDDKLAREAAERIIAETERRLRDYPITPEWKDADTVARAYLSAATTRDAVLEEALSEMIYETTHLSAPDEDGAHRCKISKATLEKARRALKSGAGEGGAA